MSFVVARRSFSVQIAKTFLNAFSPRRTEFLMTRAVFFAIQRGSSTVNTSSAVGRLDWTRGFDLILASAALLFIAPLLLVLALAVFAQDGAAPLYRQKRIGREGRIFHCLKFRSMVPNAQARLEHLLETDPAARREWEVDHKLRDDPRVTPLGRFIRRTSLDELPQLINVVAGDMSLVGPRPIVQEELVRYGSYLRHYLRVRPGITGVWQVSGRNDVSYRRRIACDVLYARRRSFGRNLLIMAATVPAVLQSRGSY